MMTSRHVLARRAVWLAFLASPTVGGCYRYTPIETGAVVPDEEVRVVVTPTAGARIAPETGAYATILDGRLTLRGPDSVSLSLPIASRNGTARVDGLRQSFSFSRAEVASVTRREVDKGKSALVAVAGLVAAGALATALVKLSTASTTPDDPDPTMPISKNPYPGVGVRLPIR